LSGLSCFLFGGILTFSERDLRSRRTNYQKESRKGG
jgi:hypothetical protein